MIGGVCGGIAEYFGIDPTIVRLLAVVITVIGNAAAVVAYIVMWVIVPEEPVGDAASEASTGSVTVPSTPPMPPAVMPLSASHPQRAEPPAVVVPHAPAVQNATARPPVQPPAGARTGMVLLGSMLILLGVAFLVSRVTDIGVAFWPIAFVGLLLVALGIRTMFAGGDDR
jgi:phage shock protein C